MPAQPSLRRLAIFEAVVRHGSAGAAAGEMGLSQPAVTVALRKLEQETGARLFDRGREGSRPTREGRILNRRVSRMRLGLQLALAETNPARPSGGAWRTLTSVQVRAHLAVAEAGSFRAGARALGLAEPSLHRAARQLEAVLGAPIYRRTPRGLSATPVGLKLARRLRLALYELDQALDEIQAERDAGAGRVGAGCLPLTPKPLLARAVGRLPHGHPSAQVTLEEAPYAALIERLGGGQLDMIVGALRGLPAGGDLVERPLFGDPHVLAARQGHPLAGRGRVSEAELYEYPWIVPAAGTPRRRFVDSLFDRLPRRPPVAAETSSTPLMTALLAETDCLTLIARSQVSEEFARGDLAVLAAGFTLPERTVGITTRRGWLPTRLQRRFLSLVREECEPTP